MRRIFRVSDGFHSHPKVMKASTMSIGAWMLAGSWVASQDSPHVPSVPRSAVASWCHDVDHVGAELVALGLWETTPVRLFDDVWEDAWSFTPDERLYTLTAIRWRPGIDPALRERVYERDGHMCRHCGTTERLSLDHIMPFSKGGPDTFANLQTLCVRCNARKGARV